MARITFKYMAQEVSDSEREKTFAARHATLNAILARLRGDIGKGSLNSFLIAGPRGAGKTTLLHMVRQSITGDAVLDKAWLPLILPEEQIAVGSLRDLLSAVLEKLEVADVPNAGIWRVACEAELDDESSCSIAVAGLRALADALSRRFLVGIENFDQVLRVALNNDRERATLRKLLLDKPFLAIVATTTSLLDIIDNYDDPLWNHFERLQLHRLQDRQVDELLKAHARYRNDTVTLDKYQDVKGIVRAMTRLTGGNPRLLLMLYDVISLKEIDSAVQALTALVDEMTPFYNGLLDRIPLSTRKVFDALMRSNGSAKPSDLTRSIRAMKLGDVTSQLLRLKSSGYVTVNMGGKGRPAFYSVSDRFFAAWYQMRYLRGGRRHIELFVEVLRAWFAPEERLAAFQERLTTSSSRSVQDPSDSTDYLLYSMLHTPQLGEALDAVLDRGQARITEGNYKASIADFSRIIEISEAPMRQRALAYLGRGMILRAIGDYKSSLADLSHLVESGPDIVGMRAITLIQRALTYEALDSLDEAVADYDRIIHMEAVPPSQLTNAIVNRANVFGKQNETSKELAGYELVLSMRDAPCLEKARALINRGVLHSAMGRKDAAFADYSAVIEMADAPSPQKAKALVNRGLVYERNNDKVKAQNDYASALEVSDIFPDDAARALVNLGTLDREAGRSDEAIAKFSRVFDIPKVSGVQRTWAFVHRALEYVRRDDKKRAVIDFASAIHSQDDDDGEARSWAFLGRALLYEDEGADSVGKAMSDYTSVILTKNISLTTMVWALIARGQLAAKSGDITQALADWSASVPLQNEVELQDNAVGFLRNIARPELRGQWPHMVDAVELTLPKSAKEGLKFLVIAGNILRGHPEAQLDQYAPEVKEFVAEVLTFFSSSTHNDRSKLVSD